MLLLEGGGVPAASPIARAPEDGEGVAPPGSGIVGPVAAGAEDAEGASDPKMMPKEAGRGASVGPAAIGLAEGATGAALVEDATGASVDPGAMMKPPGGMVMEGVTGAIETAAGIIEGEATGARESDGAGAVVPGRRWRGKAQKRTIDNELLIGGEDCEGHPVTDHVRRRSRGLTRGHCDPRAALSLSSRALSPSAL